MIFGSERIEIWKERLKGVKIGVIGDFCLDRNNVYDNTGLKSLEFEGIPIHSVVNPDNEYAPGGAGNVAINFRKLGAEVIPFGVRGMDWASLHLINLFEKQGIQNFGLIPSLTRKTPRYEKFYCDDKGKRKQFFRLDTYNDNPVSLGIQNKLLEVLEDEGRRMSGFYIADQLPDKYFPCITPELRKGLEETLTKIGMPVMVDSRERIREWGNGKFILKPNQKEVWKEYGNAEEIIMKHIFENKEMKDIFEEEMRKFLRNVNSPFIYVTLHDRGAVLFDTSSNPIYVPTFKFENGDPTGCGDAFGVAALTALLVGENPIIAARFGNVAARYTIQQIGGCGMPTLEELFKNYKEIYR